jgi:hypothetical protein
MLIKIDRANTKQSYWEKVLTSLGLGVDQGSQASARDRHAIAEFLQNQHSDGSVNPTEMPGGGYEIIDPIIGAVSKKKD